MQALPPAVVQPQLSWAQLSPESRRVHLQELGRQALKLREQKRPGLELWSELTRQAAAAYADSRLAPERQADFVIEDLAVVILGPAALKYLGWFRQITPHPLQDPLCDTFIADFNRLGLSAEWGYTHWRLAGYAGKREERFDAGLDRHFARDFRKAFNDHSDNQIFHTFFYQFIAYVTRASLTIRAASLYHELFEYGGSLADHRAALTGIQVGLFLRQLRDRGEPALSQWPDYLRAAYGLKAAGLSPSASALRQRIDRLLQQPTPADAGLRALEFGLIRLFKDPTLLQAAD